MLVFCSNYSVLDYSKKVEQEQKKLSFKENFLLRITQESTWRGIITIIALFGVQILPNQAEHIISGAVSLVASINILKTD